MLTWQWPACCQGWRSRIIAARLLESLLAGVRPADALTFSTATVLCLITMLWGPCSLPFVRFEPILLP